MNLTEGSLYFEFSKDWNVLKLDEHSGYRNGIEKLDGTKAVDFRRKIKASVQTKIFKQKLNWLTSRVLVCNLADNVLPGVQVHNLPRF